MHTQARLVEKESTLWLGALVNIFFIYSILFADGTSVSLFRAVFTHISFVLRGHFQQSSAGIMKHAYTRAFTYK
jgi:hypothetical protein